MAKNAIKLTVKVLDTGYMPSLERVMGWLEEQYAQAMRQAEDCRDGTTLTVASEFPCLEIPKDE